MSVRQYKLGISSQYLGKRSTATGVGIIAIGLWAALAAITKMTGGVPPFQILFLSFLIAFFSSIIFMSCRGLKTFYLWRQPLSVWLFCFTAIFTYHALYFYALNNAPPAEASLLAYLWPLLIVIFSILVDRRAFRISHLIGAMLGFSGCAVILLGQIKSSYGFTSYKGYIAALLCAVVWSTYSVLNRKFREVPSEFIGGVCGLVALAALVAHIRFEHTVSPTPQEWLGLILLGVGPVGLAFFAWDFATKHGHLPTIGTLSYLAPLISTLLLVFVGLTPLSWPVVVATILTVSGAVVATINPGKSRSPNFEDDGV